MGVHRASSDMPSPASQRRRHAASTRHPLLAVLSNGSLRRALAAYFVFNATELATWVAILVWAYDVGGATTAGLMAIVQLLPSALFAPLGSVLGDRIRRDHALALGYGIQAVTMTAAGIAITVDAPTAVVVVLAVLAAISVVLSRPVHHAIVPELAETPEQLTAGNAASSTMEGAALFAGPLLASICIGLSGPGAVFVVMGLLSAASALLTRNLDLRRSFDDSEGEEEGAWSAAVAGVRELARDHGALVLTLVVAAQFTVAGALDILSVVLGLDILGLGPSSPGVFVSAEGLGALIGAAATIVLVGRRRLSPAIAGGILLTGVPLMFIAFGTVPAFAFAMLAVSGFGKSFVDVSGRTLLQRTVRPDVLSRVFGLQESLLMVGLLVGSAIVPVLVGIFGPRGAFLVTGLLLPTVGLALWVWIRQLDDEALQPGPGFGLLKTVPLFALLPQGTLERLSRELGEQSYEPGSHIIEQGDRGDLFYLVVSGTVDIVRDGRVVASTTAGGYFGEIALLRDVPRTATVRAQGPVSVYTLEREQFLEAVTGSSEAHEHAHGVATQRMDELDA